MTEYELLRIIAFLERVRLPFQKLIPIAEEDATWNMLLYLIKNHLTGTPVTISTLATVAKVPHATAMRRIQRLIETGEIVTKSVSDTGKRLKLLPSEALLDSFIQYARKISPSWPKPSAFARRRKATKISISAGPISPQISFPRRD
jgi:multiple sugar transport system substrate-binding protein